MRSNNIFLNMPGFPTPIVLDQGQEQNSKGAHRINVSSVAVRFGPAKFSPLPSGKHTYSDSLSKINWDDIFPEVDVLTKYIKQETKVEHYNTIKKSSFANALLIPGFWFAAILYIIKSAIYFNDSNARNHLIDPWSFLLADVGGFFIYPSLVILFSVCERLYRLHSAKKNAQMTVKSIRKDYEVRREVLLNTRNSMMQFFALSEMFYQLVKPELTDLIKLRKELADFYNKYNLDTYGLNIDILGHLELTSLVRKTFYDERFKYLREKIIKAIKDDFMERQEYISNILLKELKLRELGQSGKLHYLTLDQIVDVLKKLDTYSLIDFCNRVDECKIIQSIVFYYIGELSSDKSEVNSSILLKPIDIFEDGIDEILKTSISNYWNAPSTKKLIHPHGIVVTKMGIVVNSQIIEQQFHLVHGSIVGDKKPIIYSTIFNKIHFISERLFRVKPTIAPKAQDTAHGKTLPIWRHHSSAMTGHHARRSTSQTPLTRQEFVPIVYSQPEQFCPEPERWTSESRNSNR